MKHSARLAHGPAERISQVLPPGYKPCQHSLEEQEKEIAAHAGCSQTTSSLVWSHSVPPPDTGCRESPIGASQRVCSQTTTHVLP